MEPICVSHIQCLLPVRRRVAFWPLWGKGWMDRQMDKGTGGVGLCLRAPHSLWRLPVLSVTLSHPGGGDGQARQVPGMVTRRVPDSTWGYPAGRAHNQGIVNFKAVGRGRMAWRTRPGSLRAMCICVFICTWSISECVHLGTCPCLLTPGACLCL